LRFPSSLASKIFAITITLLALMTAVTAVTAIMSARVGTLLAVVGEVYVPVYGMLARVHIRSLEQSFLLRRAVLANSAGGSGAQTVRDLIAQADAAGAQADTELANARALILKQAAAQSSFDDQLLLGRLDAKSEALEQQREIYTAQKAKLAARLGGANPGDIEPLLTRLDEIRDSINADLETTRRDTLALATNAVTVTRSTQQQVIDLSFLALALAILLGLLLSRRLALGLIHSMRSLVSATQAVEQGKYDTELPVTGDDEIGRLSKSFNVMVRELRLKEQIRETFGKYIDPQLARGLIDRPELTGSAGDRRVMTVYFCDLKGFSALSEEITPASLVKVLNRYFTVMSEEIRSRHGVVDKYIGDAVMAFWGPPFTAPDQQGRLACEAGLAQVKRFGAFKAEMPEILGYKRFMPQLDVRIGIATGEVLVGNIGSEVTMNYTVMGDTVNIASRLEGANKIYGTHILIDHSTAQRVEDSMVVREIDRVLFVGKTEPETIYGVMTARGQETPEMMALLAAYAEGLEAIRSRNWPAARRSFEAAIAVDASDGPSITMLERLKKERSEQDTPSWGEYWVLREK
jgi:adenylate cyclase